MAKKDSNRRGFSLKTIGKIKERANYICTNPDCRRTTFIPEYANDNETLFVGVAAHIVDASNGFNTRTDPSLTEQQIASADNGIYLCSTCATMIDKNNGHDYPTYKLKEWKLRHDEWLRNQHKNNDSWRREKNKDISPYFTNEEQFPFISEERASGQIFIPEDDSKISARFINISGRIDKTVPEST